MIGGVGFGIWARLRDDFSAAAVPDRFAELEARFAAEKETMTLRYREKLAVTTTDGRIPAGIPNRGSERDSPFLAPCPS